MTQTDQTLDVIHCISETFLEVFETMLSMKAEPASGQDKPPQVDRVTGSVGFGGEAVTGAAYIHMSVTTAAQAAAAMLGMPAHEVGDTDVNDVVGELCNMVTGGLKSSLCNAGMPCAMSTPAIIRGKSFDIEPMPNVRREVIHFVCQGERIVVEIHIKFD